MIKDILDKTNISDSRQERNRWYWNYTCNGAERCNDFYNAAIELGYLGLFSKQPVNAAFHDVKFFSPIPD